MATKPYDRPHIFVHQPPVAEKFTSTQAGGGKRKLKAHDRKQHGKKLLQELAAAVGADDSVDTPVRVEFQSEPGFDLTLKSLDTPARGLELLSVREHGDVTYATMLISRSGIPRFQHLINQYISQATPQGKPRNHKLIDSIAAVRRAVLESLWTEFEVTVPSPETEAWFEVWLSCTDCGSTSAFARPIRARPPGLPFGIRDRHLTRYAPF